jgi:hypothetical protein
MGISKREASAILLSFIILLAPIFLAVRMRRPIPVFLSGHDPVLESILQSIDGSGSETEYCVKLMLWVHNRVRHYPDMPITHPTIYEVIERGWGYCSESSEVLIALCLEAGFPSRMLALKHADGVSGHNVVETYVDGRWILLDPDYGRVYPFDNGTLANAMELNGDPSLIDDEDMRAYYHSFAVSETFGRDMKGILFRILVNHHPYPVYIEYSNHTRHYLYEDMLRWKLWMRIPTYTITLIYYSTGIALIYLYQGKTLHKTRRNLTNPMREGASRGVRG